MRGTNGLDLALTDFVDLETLQSLQDGFARLTGVATSIRDPDGNPITKTAGESSFCALMKSSPTGQAACRQSHVSASRLVQTTDLPCRHQCHAAMAQFVAPIIVEGRHLGAIIVGDRPLGEPSVEALTSLGTLHGLPLDRLTVAAQRLKPWSDEAMTAATTFVQHLANAIAQLCYQSHQLRRRADELAALYNVASMLAGRVELQEILDTATGTLVETMSLRAAAVRLLDEDTGELRIASVAHLPMDYLDTEPILLSQSPIDCKALETGHTEYVEDVRTDPRTYHQDRAKREGLVSALMTPLIFGGQRIGLLRAYMGERHRFTPFEVSLLEGIASQVAAAIVNARLRRDATEAERLDRQVRLAGEIQRRMIPARPPEHARYRFGCVYEPSAELGGDFYDFIPLPNGDIGVVIADVVGKGVPASLMMASARSALRSHAKRMTDIGELMRAVNLRLCHDTLPSEFVTAFYAVLSGDGKRLRYCNAGHEPLLLLRQSKLSMLDVGGLVLGLDPEAAYECGEAELEPQDVLVLVTDGLIEAMNYAGQAYGRERLHSSIKLHGSVAPDLPVDLIAKQLLWDVRRFSGLAAHSDDITLVVTRVS
jgi:serine phosphatase RsbU (regulator of sigma subunit)